MPTETPPLIARSRRDLEHVWQSLGAAPETIPASLVLAWLLGRSDKGPGTMQARRVDEVGVTVEFEAMIGRLRRNMADEPLEVAVRVFAWCRGYTDELPSVVVSGLL